VAVGRPVLFSFLLFCPSSRLTGGRRTEYRPAVAASGELQRKGRATLLDLILTRVADRAFPADRTPMTGSH